MKFLKALGWIAAFILSLYGGLTGVGIFVIVAIVKLFRSYDDGPGFTWDDVPWK